MKTSKLSDGKLFLLTLGVPGLCLCSNSLVSAGNLSPPVLKHMYKKWAVWTAVGDCVCVTHDITVVVSTRPHVIWCIRQLLTLFCGRCGRVDLDFYFIL